MSREAQILKEFQKISYSEITGDLMDPNFLLNNQATLQQINKVIDELKKKQITFSIEELITAFVQTFTESQKNPKKTELIKKMTTQILEQYDQSPIVRDIALITKNTNVSPELAFLFYSKFNFNVKKTLFFILASIKVIQIKEKLSFRQASSKFVFDNTP